MAKQSREQLGVQEGDQIILKGKVAFARVDKPVEGEALNRENERRAKSGRIQADKPFRTIAIEEPEIVIGEGTPLANFHGQEVYQSKTTHKQTMSFESKSPFPPTYGHLQEDGSTKEIKDPEKNPDQGQVVFLVINTYVSKGFNKLGSTFDAIVFDQGPINFYEGRNSSLEGFGRAMGTPVTTLSQQGISEPATPEPVTAGANSNQGFGGFGSSSTDGSNQGGFGSAPAADSNQPNTQGSFGGFNQPADQNQTQTTPTQNPFGVQENNIPTQGSPFSKNNGQSGKNPFA